MTSVPVLGGGLPWLGHAAAFRHDPVALLEEGLVSCGEIFRFTLFGKSVYALLSPRGHEAFFTAADDQLNIRAAYRFTVPIFGDGVAYAVSRELMDEQLRFIYPALRDEAMQSHARIMAEEVERFVERLGPSGEIDLLPALNELTIFIAGRCLIGEEFRSRLSAEFAALYHTLEGGINMIAFMAPRFPSPANLRRDRARRRVAALVGALIADRRRTGATGKDFLSVLIAARDKNGAALSDAVITGLLLTLLFAGQHTSAVLATWLGVLLLRHPGEIDALRREADAVIDDGPLFLNALRQLHRLDQCLKEAERLHPPLIMLMRTVSRPFPVGAAVLPPGSLALVSPAVGHRLSGVFADPDRFDPGRFAPPREEDRKTPFALIGFGGGKHRCTGLAFACQQIKLIWTLLLRRFDFDLVDPAPRPNYATFVVGPRPPTRVRYSRRATVGPRRSIPRDTAA